MAGKEHAKLFFFQLSAPGIGLRTQRKVNVQAVTVIEWNDSKSTKTALENRARAEQEQNKNRALISLADRTIVSIFQLVPIRQTCEEDHGPK